MTYVMIDELSLYASEAEAVAYIERAKRLPQTEEVSWALQRAEKILGTIRSQVSKEFTSSGSATSGLTAYSLEGQKDRRRTKLRVRRDRKTTDNGGSK